MKRLPAGVPSSGLDRPLREGGSRGQSLMQGPPDVPQCLLILAVVVGGLGPAGCSSGPAKPEDPSMRNLRKIAQAYELANEMRGRPPRGGEELRGFLKELGEKGDSDQILRSPRDGQPYVIIFGATLDVAAPATVLAYEQHGAGGTRYVLTVARDVKQMGEDEFAKASFAKGHKPSPA